MILGQYDEYERCWTCREKVELVKRKRPEEEGQKCWWKDGRKR